MTIHNLPHQPTSFIGRANELTSIATLLSDPNCRLLTILGPGGIGKTRLSLQVADQLLHDAHNLFFVSLAPISSPNLIASAIASALDISFQGLEDPRLQIVQHLRDKHMLLIIDNFEHLLAGSDLLTDILQAAAGVKFLITSRERLNMQEEWVLLLDGLMFPKDGIDASNDTLENYSAIQLFVQRARQVQVSFSLTENATAVQTICQRVEGMPLALELAATWLRVMSCRQIATELESNLEFLTTPLRNVPERHRSLRAVFEQSWRLLDASEKAALMRLSVFRGGFDREAAEQVAGASLPLLAGLADKSLLRLRASERYDLHELIRQYAAGKLLEAGEEHITNQRHFDYFLKLVERAEAHAFGREQIFWFDRLEAELDNLRAALGWSMNSEAGLRFAAAMGWFFSERTHWIEGLDWLTRALAANQDTPASLRSKALHSAGALAHLQGDKRTKTLLDEALTLARATNDRWNSAWSLSHLALWLGNNQSAALLDESLALFRELDDPMGISHTLVRRAWNAIDDQRDYPYARSLLEEALGLAHEAGDTVITAWVTYTLGRISRHHDHDLMQAKAHIETSLSLFREARFQISSVLYMLADIEQVMGNLVRAQTLYGECLAIQEGIAPNHPFTLAGLASIATAHKQFSRAAILLGAVDRNAISAVLDKNFWPVMSYNSDIVVVRDQLGEAAFAEAWAAGKAMTPTQIVAYALERTTTPSKTLPVEGTASEPIQSQQATKQALNAAFSSRELEILRLLADGLSNREIASTLFLAPSTVKWYVSELLSKLTVSNRTQAGLRARGLGLLT